MKTLEVFRPGLTPALPVPSSSDRRAHMPRQRPRPTKPPPVWTGRSANSRGVPGPSLHPEHRTTPEV